MVPTTNPSGPPSLIPSLSPTVNITSKVLSFILVDADTNLDIQNIVDGDELFFDSLDGHDHHHLSVRANTDPPQVSSVAFFANDTPIANEDASGSYVTWPILSMETQSLRIKAIPELAGFEGLPLEIDIGIKTSSASSEP